MDNRVGMIACRQKLSADVTMTATVFAASTHQMPKPNMLCIFHGLATFPYCYVSCYWTMAVTITYVQQRPWLDGLNLHSVDGQCPAAWWLCCLLVTAPHLPTPLSRATLKSKHVWIVDRSIGAFQDDIHDIVKTISLTKLVIAIIDSDSDDYWPIRWCDSTIVLTLMNRWTDTHRTIAYITLAVITQHTTQS